MSDYQWEVEEPDFRRTAFTPTTHDGKPYLIAVCQTFEGGKWEGFVAMKPVRADRGR